MAMEQTHLARLVYCIKELKVPQRCIKQVKTDCLLLQDYPKSKEKHLIQLTELTYAQIGSIRNKDQSQRLIDDNGVKISFLSNDHQKIYRCQATECKPLMGIYRTPKTDQEVPSLPDGYSEIIEDEAYVTARDKGLLILGAPGVGKTHFARQLVGKLRENGHIVEVIAKTHSAVRNFGIEGCYTADHWVIRHIKTGRPRCQYLVIEELSMINSMLWCHLALAKMYGLIFIVCGDFNQFGPICDSFAGCQVPEDKLEHSQLLLDLVGGNSLRLYKNWRSDPHPSS